MRPRGTVLSMALRTSGVAHSFDPAPSVSTGPGAMALTRILWCAHSNAHVRRRSQDLGAESGAQLLGRRLEMLGTAAREHKSRAQPRVFERDRPADASPASGDDGHATVKRAIRKHLSPLTCHLFW